MKTISIEHLNNVTGGAMGSAQAAKSAAAADYNHRFVGADFDAAFLNARKVTSSEHDLSRTYKVSPRASDGYGSGTYLGYYRSLHGAAGWTAGPVNRPH